jgi:hypothetical protein
MTATEKDALAALLDATDRQLPELPALLAARPREGEVFGLLARHELLDDEVRLLLVALSARLSGKPALPGAELSRRAASGSAQRLAALALLAADGRLVARGLLLPDTLPVDGPAAETAAFRVADHVLRRACAVFALRAPEPRAAASGPYRSQAELVSDLRRLSLAWRRRAARVFQLDPWSGTGIETHEAVGELIAEARAHGERLARRLAATPPAEALPLLRFARAHDLGLDELVILVTVMFQELVEGVGAVDAVDLVKLVSESEADLLRRRQLLRPLQRKGLLQLEGAYEGKDLTADASLPNKVVDEMLGARAAKIRADERLDFHEYLRQLESSDPFFTGLTGEGPPA